MLQNVRQLTEPYNYQQLIDLLHTQGVENKKTNKQKNSTVIFDNIGTTLLCILWGNLVGIALNPCSNYIS